LLAVENEVEHEYNDTHMSFKATISDIYHAGHWTKLEDYTFNDGTTDLPNELTPPDSSTHHHIHWWIRAVAGIFFLVSFSVAIKCIVWIERNRDNRIVKVSQPIFLRIICAGAIIMTCAIIPLNIDDGIASHQICSIACNFDTWLMFLGFSIMFSALFTKIRRVYELMYAAENQGQQRVKLSLKDAVLPVGVMVGANFLILCVMTVVHPSKWEIVPIHMDQHDRWIETYGHCTHGEQLIYYSIMGGLNFFALLYSMYLSYRTRKISTEFAESRYIMYAVIAILVTLFQAVPVLFMVRNDRDTQDFLKCSFIFVCVCSVLLFIFYPKMKFLNKRANDNTEGAEDRWSGIVSSATSGGSDGMQIIRKTTGELADENAKLKKLLDKKMAEKEPNRGFITTTTTTADSVIRGKESTVTFKADADDWGDEEQQ